MIMITVVLREVFALDNLLSLIAHHNSSLTHNLLPTTKNKLSLLTLLRNIRSTKLGQPLSWPQICFICLPSEYGYQAFWDRCFGIVTLYHYSSVQAFVCGLCCLSRLLCRCWLAGCSTVVSFHATAVHHVCPLCVVLAAW